MALMLHTDREIEKEREAERVRVGSVYCLIALIYLHILYTPCGGHMDLICTFSLRFTTVTLHCTSHQATVCFPFHYYTDLCLPFLGLSRSIVCSYPYPMHGYGYYQNYLGVTCADHYIQ